MIANKTPKIVPSVKGKPETPDPSQLKEPDMLLTAMPVFNPSGLLQGKSGVVADRAKK